MHKNKINGKCYIGLTKTSLNQRAGNNGYGYKRCLKFYRAIEKYGWDNFEHIILFDNLSREEAALKEQETIKLFDSIKNGYNADNGGFTGHHSEETLQRIREKTKEANGKSVCCYETNKRYETIKEASLDTGVDSASIIRCCKKQQCVAGNLHWYYADEQAPEFHRDKRFFPVLCITTGKAYPTIAEAARDTNSDFSAIRKVCVGKYKSTNSLKWKYLSNEEYDNIINNKEKIQPVEFTPSVLENRIAVQQVDLETGEIVAEYVSTYAAGQATGIDRSSIGKCCRGKAKKTFCKKDNKWYTWRNS